MDMELSTTRLLILLILCTTSGCRTVEIKPYEPTGSPEYEFVDYIGKQHGGGLVLKHHELLETAGPADPYGQSIVTYTLAAGKFAIYDGNNNPMMVFNNEHAIVLDDDIAGMLKYILVMSKEADQKGMFSLASLGAAIERLCLISELLSPAIKGNNDSARNAAVKIAKHAISHDWFDVYIEFPALQVGMQISVNLDDQEKQHLIEWARYGEIQPFVKDPERDDCR